MNTKQILWGLIFATTAIFSTLYIVASEYELAALAVILGLIWLVLETNERPGSGSIFFLIFLVLAILGSLRHLAAPVILLGLSSTLAAWDLSRFRARIARHVEPIAKTDLETGHVQKLAVTAVIGYFAALLPVVVQFPIDFVILCLLILATIFTLRWAALYLRDNVGR